MRALVVRLWTALRWSRAVRWLMAVARRLRLHPTRWGLLFASVMSLMGMALLAGLILGAEWLLLGRPSFPHPKTVTADAVKIGLAVVAGLVAAFGLTVSYRKQRGEEEKSFTDRYTSAAEQLGHAKAAVRLAGVYAMGRLADDWEPHRQACIDVLCAYLRMPYNPESAEPGEQEVRWTIIRLIRDHLRGSAAVSWQGYDFDFTGAVFDGGSFDAARFVGSDVSFDRAHFLGGQVSFIGARFTGGQVSFYAAEFTGSQVSFTGTRFTDAQVIFAAAKFTSGEVSFGATELTSGEVSFAGARFNGGVVSFAAARFTGGWVSFDYAQFSGGGLSFYGARFTGGEVSFIGAGFSSGDVSFVGAEFTGGQVSFNGAEFTGGQVDFTEVAGSLYSAVIDLPPDQPGVLYPPADHDAGS